MIKLAPSLLAADFSKLGEEIKKVHNSGAQYLHLDVMDGMFVPNISLGTDLIKSIRKVTDIVFDVHLMIEDPIRYIEAYKNAGAEIITFHYEACEDRQAVIDLIHSFGLKAGMSVKPETDADLMAPFMDSLDLCLVMTVHPGFGGQKFMPEAVENIVKLDKLIKKSGRDIELEVDGGINLENAKIVKDAGANVLVAGSAVFRAENVEETVKAFLK